MQRAMTECDSRKSGEKPIKHHIIMNLVLENSFASALRQDHLQVPGLLTMLLVACLDWTDDDTW